MSESHLPIDRSAPDADLDEDRLIQLGERLRRGDEAALEAFLDEYWARLHRYAARLVGSEDVAEDMVQEAFVRLWNGRRARPTDASVAGFLYTVTRNLCLNERRRGRIRMRLTLARATRSIERPNTPLEETEASEVAAALRVAIAALPKRRREIFELTREHGLSHREIASVLGISRQTVANQMSTALDQLRFILRAHS